ncbi:hypothetical protein ACHQM5_009016 [Ranunculus cassubicifolius]
MEQQEQHSFAINVPPPIISLTPSITRRRLSSQFSEPTRPINSGRRLSWVSLQGRLIGAEEASLGRTINGGLSREEIVAWDLFSPIHRILIVAIVAVASNDLKKLKQIQSLRRSVELRDQVLLSMQQKLDNLCDQMNNMKERPEITDNDNSCDTNGEFQFSNCFQSNKSKHLSCDCCSCDHHQDLFNDVDSFADTYSGDVMSKFKMTHSITTEQEERRMSDLSDWASSVTSAADMQLSALGIEQEVYNLQKECEEKDATIKELSTAIRSAEIAGSKRIAELEDVIRRKNMTITKLKKDMIVLEQKVMHLARLRRPSSAPLTVNTQKLPMMTDNVLYNMDSSTSPSSSDSDSDMKSQPQISDTRESASTVNPPMAVTMHPVRSPLVSSNVNDPARRSQNLIKTPKSQPVSPLTENIVNRRRNSTLRPKQVPSPLGDMKRNRRRNSLGSKDGVTSKRWT